MGKPLPFTLVSAAGKLSSADIRTCRAQQMTDDICTCSSVIFDEKNARKQIGIILGLHEVKKIIWVLIRLMST